MSNGGYYGWRSLRYFLFEYECQLQLLQRRKTPKIDWAVLIKDDYSHDHTSVEHVFPQSMRGQTYWKDRFGTYENKHLKRLRNSLGNLVATSQPRNSSLQNKSFIDKRDGTTSSSICYRSGGYGEIEIAKELDWTANQILDRGLRLLDFARARWDLPLPATREDRAKVLGLEFVVNKS